MKRFNYWPAIVTAILVPALLVLADTMDTLTFSSFSTLTCGAGNAGKMRPTTTGVIQVCDNAGTPALKHAALGDSSGNASAVADNSVALGTKTTGNYALGDAEGGAATTGDSATGFFSSGQIEAARGGTGIDTSGSTGTLIVTAGTWSANTSTGTGDSVRGTSPTIATPNLTGKIDFNNVAVDDDDCTGEQGKGWYDTTDEQYEFCNANSGTPIAFGAGGAGANISFDATNDAVNESTAITHLECSGNGMSCSEPSADQAQIALDIGSGATQVAAGDHAHAGSTPKYYEDWTANQSIQSGSATNIATQDTRNGHLALVFPDGTDTSAYFHGRINGYAGGGLNVVFSIMCDAATSGTARVITRFESMTDDADDADADSFGTQDSVGCACPNVAGERKYCTISHADGAELDSLADGEDYRLELIRDGDGTTGSDDLVDEMQLVITSVEEP